MTAEKQAAVAAIEKKADLVAQVADEIWSFAELSLQEEQSADLYCRVLEQEGFKVERGICNIPTAFSAFYGSGRPIIGLLAEYDALSGLSQKGGSLTREELVSGGCGHGCGHNLLGAGAMAAALGVKAYLEAAKIPGTVVLYGCPGEEGGAAKAFMARDGLWYGLDAALTWHPDDANEVLTGSSNSCIQTQYHFTGVAAHAAGDPDRGRSALDAVELMNVGANYLREHVQPSCRIQYVITDGGKAPNIVPDRAQVWYTLRAPESALVDDMHQRLVNIAKGAALMTQTQCEEAFVSGCYAFLPNMTLAENILAHMREVGAPGWTDSDRAFAGELYRQVPEDCKESSFVNYSLKDGDVTDGLVNGIYDGFYRNGAMGASTDLGDVSWQIPVGCFSGASTVVGAPGHSWFYTAACGSGIGARAACAAAKVLALTGWDLLTDAELLRRVRNEHEKSTEKRPYVCPMK